MSRKDNGQSSNGKRARADEASVERPSVGSVTLSDVARLAGVGTTTVSRALNHPDQVAQKTLKKVNQAIELTGYVPNQIAGALASRRSHLIAAIIPSISNTVYAETIKHFSKILRDSGYQVLLGETDYLEDQEETLVRTVLSRKPDGIFFIGINHTAICRRQLLVANIPVVETWDLTKTPLDMVVGFSHEEVGKAIAEYLLEKKISRVGSIWALDHRAQLRRKGFLETLAFHGINSKYVCDVSVPTNFGQGREGLTRLINEGFNGGAVVCSSDTIAHGVLAEAQTRGLRVPEEMAVTGFGDQTFAPFTNPSLTTVKFDRELIGRRAAEVLLARINDEKIEEYIIDVGFEIIERKST
ncbi:MAG: LacI family transcriptional regulator [Desulfuromonas sp.]|nr:MAG: LacI family transcriptional regulator [Desulfuromonas sp.]